MNTMKATTTDESLSGDLLASLIASDLDARGLCVMRSAERTARLCVSLFEPDTYDAALWKSAEAIYRFMDGRADAVDLINRDASVRALYLTMAIQAWASLRLALEGGVSRESLATANAAISNHKLQLADRAPKATVIPFDGGRQ